MANINISASRDSNVQTAINAVAKRYLRSPGNDYKQWLRRILGSEPKFTYNEAKLLFSRVGATGLRQSSQIQRMYNWSLTLDRVMNYFKSIATHVASLDSNILLSSGNGDVTYLKQLIIHPSFKNWGVGSEVTGDSLIAVNSPQNIVELKGFQPIRYLLDLADGKAMYYFGDGTFRAHPAEHVPWSPANEDLMNAIHRSGVMSKINKYYRNLSIEFNRVLNMSPAAQPAFTGINFGKNQISGPMYGGQMKCGRGMIPQFRDAAGNVIPTRDVYINVNGKKYLSPMVDPSQSTCVPMVAAPWGAPISRATRNPADQQGVVTTRATLPFDASAKRTRKRRVVRRKTVVKRKPAVRRRRVTHRAMVLKPEVEAMVINDEFKAPVRRRRRTTKRVVKKRPVVRKRKRVVRRTRL